MRKRNLFTILFSISIFIILIFIPIVPISATPVVPMPSYHSEIESLFRILFPWYCGIRYRFEWYSWLVVLGELVASVGLGVWLSSLKRFR